MVMVCRTFSMQWICILFLVNQFFMNHKEFMSANRLKSHSFLIAVRVLHLLHSLLHHLWKHSQHQSTWDCWYSCHLPTACRAMVFGYGCARCDHPFGARLLWSSPNPTIWWLQAHPKPLWPGNISKRSCPSGCWAEWCLHLFFTGWSEASWLHWVRGVFWGFVTSILQDVFCMVSSMIVPVHDGIQVVCWNPAGCLHQTSCRESTLTIRCHVPGPRQQTLQHQMDFSQFRFMN